MPPNSNPNPVPPPTPEPNPSPDSSDPPKAISADMLLKQDEANKPASVQSLEQQAMIKKELDRVQQNMPSDPKNKVRTPKKNHSFSLVVLLTLIVMVLMIGLAYYAYNKSK